MAELILQNLTKIYRHPKLHGVNTPILSGLDATFKSGLPSLIQGVSGSGKTTLFKVIRGIEPIDAGEIYLDDKLVISADGKLTEEFSGSVSYLDQFPGNILHFGLTALENLIYFHRYCLNSKKEEANSEAVKLLEFFGIDEVKDQNLASLSRGELQRVAASMILSIKKRIVLCDEPTASLDRKNKDLIARKLKEYGLENDCIIIVSSHDTNLNFGGRQFELKGGRVY